MADSAYNKVLSQADDAADRILRATKVYLPHLARFCLIATFMEDGLRMWFQWGVQKDYVHLTWGCGEFLAHLFVLVNMVCQLVGCGLVLVRKFVPIAVGMLFGVIALQVGQILPEYTFVLLHKIQMNWVFFKWKEEIPV